MVPLSNDRTCFVTSFITSDTDTTLVIMVITTGPLAINKERFQSQFQAKKSSVNFILRMREVTKSLTHLNKNTVW